MKEMNRVRILECIFLVALFVVGVLLAKFG